MLMCANDKEIPILNFSEMNAQLVRIAKTLQSFGYDAKAELCFKLVEFLSMECRAMANFEMSKYKSNILSKRKE